MDRYDIRMPDDSIYNTSLHANTNSNCKRCNRDGIMNGYIFGVNIVTGWGEGDKLFVFIDEKLVYEDKKEYTGQVTDEIWEQLRSLDIQNDSETVWSQPKKIIQNGKYKEVNKLTRNELILLLRDLGFEYNEEFENECVNLKYP